jgi:hypothetical protein
MRCDGICLCARSNDEATPDLDNDEVSASGRSWSRQTTAGVAFLILTIAMVILASVFGAGVFDKLLHISKTQIISGTLALTAAISLIVGVTLTWNPCQPRRI